MPVCQRPSSAQMGQRQGSKIMTFLDYPAHDFTTHYPDTDSDAHFREPVVSSGEGPGNLLGRGYFFKQSFSGDN